MARPIIDPETWASLESLEASGAPGFLRELVKEFLTQAPQRLERLREAASSGDAKALEREAHGFKGSCGSVGAFAMAESCDQLESIGREGSCNGHGEALSSLERHWLGVRAALEGELARLA